MEPAEEQEVGIRQQYPNNNLLELSQTQWWFGDWESLTRVKPDTLQDHPDRSKIALFAAAAHLQLGNYYQARQYLQMAHAWGCSREMVIRLLLSGVHNSLGRAATIARQEKRAWHHFSNSINIGIPQNDTILLLQARIAQQLKQLGHLSPSSDHTLAQFSLVMADTLPNRDQMRLFGQLTFKFRQLARFDLGMAWAGNTINTSIYRHHAIVTKDDYQYAAFYVDEHTIRLVQRHLISHTTDQPEQPPCIYDLIGTYNLADAHNGISMGIDRSGYLHICYDHHSTKVRYRRALVPQRIDCWSEELPMTGQYEEMVTYPTFILPHDHSPLTILYRDGTWNKGCARIKTYDESSQCWTDHTNPIVSGSHEKPWPCNPYWNHPVVDHHGNLHLSFVWRTHSLGKEHRVNNINICYAYSHDNGINWMTSRGQPYNLPITPVNAETVFPVSPGSNLINQCSMAVDTRNHPHIVFFANDDYQIPQYQHLWFDGHKWHNQLLSRRNRAFNLQGSGTLQLPISRPEILIDNDDNLIVIYRGDLTADRMVAQLIPPPYHRQACQELVLLQDNLGYAEPILDRIRWAKCNVLTMLIQNNQQPDGDREKCTLYQPISLIDFCFL